MLARGLLRLGVFMLALTGLSLHPMGASLLKDVFVSAAWADDGDGDGDDGDGDDGDDGDDNGSYSGGNTRDGASDARSSNPNRQRARTQARRAQQAAAIPRPAQAPEEIVVSNISNPDLNLLLTEGYSVIETIGLLQIDRVMTRLSAPSGVTLEAALNRVRALASGQTADFNHFYRSERNLTTEVSSAPCTHENCASWELINWPMQALTQGNCPITVPVGIIDTGINATHEIVETAQLEVITLADEKSTPSKAIHGTAVASILVGGADTRVPGLISAAQIVAIDAFSRDGGDERADVVSLLRGLDVLAEKGVRVINLSLVGPENRLLADVVERLISIDQIVVVAAAGNGGRKSTPAYPAALDNVIAVTAVDANARIYRQAQRGAYVDLAAPGVNMLVATSVRGARLKSGTSFATPFVTAAVAVMLSQNEGMGVDQVIAQLQNSATDLGAEGADEIFGHGLISGDGLCGP